MVYLLRESKFKILLDLVSEKLYILLKVKSPRLYKLLDCPEYLSISLNPYVPATQNDDLYCKLPWQELYGQGGVLIY